MKTLFCLTAVVTVAFSSPVHAEPPIVAGQPATVYVDDDGIIVGGPLEGWPHLWIPLLIGTNGDDLIAGTDGFDLIYARGGADIIDGKNGGDVIFAGRGDDRIDGGAGLDFANGGRGHDICTPETEYSIRCEEEGPLVDLNFVWFVDPADSRLLIINKPDGTRVVYFGTRDENGVVTAVTSARVTDPDSKVTSIEFGEMGLPKLIITPDKFSIGFNFLTPTSVLMTLITPDGAGQANVVVNLEENSNLVSSVVSLKSAVRTDPIEVLALPYSPMLKQKSLATSSSSQLTINVSRCGNPEDNALVFAYLNTASGLPQEFQAFSVGSGKYAIYLPTTNVDPSQFGAICNSIVGKVGDSCIFFDNLNPALELKICSSLAAPFLATPLPGVDEAIVFGACEVGMNAGKLYCAVFNASPAPGAPSVANAICDTFSAAIDWALEDEVDISATAILSGSPSMSDSVDNVPAEGPFPDLTIDLAGSGPEITSFVTSPLDPGEFEGYIAMVELDCLPPNAIVDISVSGTDGYFDSTSCGFTTSSSGTCLLSVPGAEAGVVDTITVSIVGGATRTITLVF